MKLKYIKRDRALLLTSILLMLMLAAGMFSGIVGFTLGHAALKGVTQPDIRPSNKSSEHNKTRGLEVLNEQKLIAEAQDVMGFDRKNEADKFKTDEKPTLVFPIESKDQGIILIVRSAQLEGNNVKLDLALRNQGSQPIKFNQGVLTVVGDKEQPIAFNSAGLPPSLAANGKDVSMKITIAKTVVATAGNVTVRLTDSERKLQLEVKDIPTSQTVAKPPIKISIPDGQLSTTKEDEDQKKLEKPNPPGKAEQPEKPEKPANVKPSAKPSRKPVAAKPAQPPIQQTIQSPPDLPPLAPPPESPPNPAADPAGVEQPQ
jgi:hypothetical protein